MKLAAGSNMTAAVNRILEGGEFLVLVEIARKAGGYFRLVKNNRNIEAGGVPWIAADIRVDFPEEDSEGTLGQMSLSIGNVSRQPLLEVELNGELLGSVVTVRVVHRSVFSDLSQAVSWRHIITNVTANEQILTATCQHQTEGLTVPGGTIGPDQFPALAAIA